MNISIKARVTLENDPQATGNIIRIPISLGFDIVAGKAIYEVSLPKLPRPPLLYGGGSMAIYITSITAYVNNKMVNTYFTIWINNFNRGYVSLSPISLAQGNIETYTGSINVGTASLRMNTVIDIARKCEPTYDCEYICLWWWCGYICHPTTTCQSAATIENNTANIEINITFKIIITPIAELRSQ